MISPDERQKDTIGDASHILSELLRTRPYAATSIEGPGFFRRA